MKHGFPPQTQSLPIPHHHGTRNVHKSLLITCTASFQHLSYLPFPGAFLQPPGSHPEPYLGQSTLCAHQQPSSTRMLCYTTWTPLIILFVFTDVLRLICSVLMRHLFSIRRLLQKWAVIPVSFADELITTRALSLLLVPLLCAMSSHTEQQCFEEK